MSETLGKVSSRTIYFIRDTVTGKYIVQQGLLFGDFANAVIHTTENSVTCGIKKRCTEYRHHLKISDESANSYRHMRVKRGSARKREKLPNFGMEVVELTLQVRG